MKFDPGKLTPRLPPGDRDFIRYHPDACSGCGQCALTCVAELWSMEAGIARLASGQRTRCLECGACFHACPTRAIDFQYPAGGTGIVYQHG